MKNWRGVGIGLGALITIVLAYALSHAVYLALRYEKPGPNVIGMHPHYDMNDPYFSHSSHTFFVPVEYMIDSTIMRKPLLAWSGILGSRSKVKSDSLTRLINRRFGGLTWEELARTRP